MTQEEQIEFLGLAKLNVLAQLKDMIPDFAIGGSISLIEYGVCKRKVQDIDIVVANFDLILNIAKQDIRVDYDFDYDSELQGKGTSAYFEKGKIPNQARFEIDGVHICAFYGNEIEYKMCDYMFDKTFKVSHPRYAIEAKKRYLNCLLEREKLEPLNEYNLAKRVKHTADIEAFEAIFPSVVVDYSDFPF